MTDQPGNGDRPRRGLHSWIQDRPRMLVGLWKCAERAMPLLERPLTRFGTPRVSAVIEPVERLVKKPLFDCRMCGQCILHQTGMTCPMTCPKQLRNGPCGGVGMDASCEVNPEKPCIWVEAIDRAGQTPYAEDLGRLNAPVDWRLNATSSWINAVNGDDQITSGIGTGPSYASEVFGK